MNVLDYKYITKFLDSFSFKDVKNIFNIEDNITANIYGNYYIFIKDQIEKNGFLYNLFNFIAKCEDNDKQNKNDRNKKLYNWIIIAKKGYIKYFKDCINYFINYFCKRNDLNLLSRIRLSILKTKHHVGRIKFALDIYEYNSHRDANNKKIKTLFEFNAIDRIYIYKVTYKKMINEAKFESLFKQ